MTPPYFCIFVIIFSLKRTWPLIEKKKQLEFPSPKDDLYQILIEISLLVQEMIYIKKKFSVFYFFAINVPSLGEEGYLFEQY
jgi:hypothetical protein